MNTQPSIRNIACSLVIILICFSCNNREKTILDPAFKAYISALTTGTISSETPIRIQLANDIIKSNEVGSNIQKTLFEFSPAIKGTAIWKDERTIEFRPAVRMEQGQQYKATFHLG